MKTFKESGIELIIERPEKVSEEILKSFKEHVIQNYYGALLQAYPSKQGDEEGYILTFDEGKYELWLPKETFDEHCRMISDDKDIIELKE